MHQEELHKIEQELANYETQLYAASTEYRDYRRDAAEKRADYDVSYANAILTISNKADTEGIKMNVVEKESLAVKSVANQLKACRIAEALAEGSKSHLITLQSILSSVQTRASLLKTERSLVSMMT
jgi:hypothetical protein